MSLRIFVPIGVVVVASVGLVAGHASERRAGPTLAKSSHRLQRVAVRGPHPRSGVRVSQALTDRFAVLRLSTPRTAADEVALGRAAAMAPASGVAFDQSRRLATLGTRAVWIAPSDNGLCFFDRDLAPSSREVGPGSSCGTDDVLVLRGEFWMTSGNAGQGGADLLALVPDGVPSATVTFADGTSTEVPIRNNTLALHVLKATAGYSYESTGGTVTVSARTYHD